MGHLTFVSKRLSAVGNKRILQFFDSAREPCVICRFHMGFPVVVVLNSYLLEFFFWNMPLFKVWSEDKLNKKFVVAENFAELTSKR